MKTGRKESPQKGNEEGGLSSDGVVVYEYLNKQEADFLYHEIFVHQCYFSSSCVSSTENDISEMCDEEKEKEKEVRESDDIQLSINDGDCVVDIGANIGLFSLFCLAIADNLTIIACEPIPDICRVLHRNLQSYKKNNKIFIQQCAVGKTLCLDETFVFNRNAPGESCRLVNYDEYKQQQDVLTSIKGQINYENCIIDGVIGGEKGENTSSAGELRSGVAVGVNNDDFNETLGRVNGSVLTLSDVIKSTIDKWLPKEENQLQFIANIDILKIDCEGDELEVLLGIDASCTCSCTCGSGDDCSCMHIWPCLWGRIQQVVAEVHNVQPTDTFSNSLIHECTDSITFQDGRLQHVINLLKRKGRFSRVTVRKQHTLVCDSTGYTMVIPDELNLFYVYATRESV